MNKVIGLDISVLNEKNKTGIGIYVYELIKALLEINRKDKFIIFGLTPFANFSYLSSLPFKGYPNTEVKLYRIPARLFRSAYLLWQKVDWPKIEAFTGTVDIFHSFNWVLPPQKKGKRLATVFDLTSIKFPDWHHPRTSELDKIRFERIKKDADLVLTISENSKKDFLEFAPELQVKVINPGISEKFSKPISQNEIKRIVKKYNLPKKYILSVSTIEPRKNIQGLIEAFLKTKIDMQLVLVGSSGWKNEKEFELIRENKKIINLGYVSEGDLPAIYKLADFFVYPSFYEGFGIPILEAMSMGVPVICSNTSSLPEVAGNAAFFVNPYKIEEIKNALERLGKDLNLRNQLSKMGLVQSQKFSWRKSALELNKIYQNL